MAKPVSIIGNGYVLIPLEILFAATRNQAVHYFKQSKELQDDNRSLLLTIRASLPLPLGETLIFLGNQIETNPIFSYNSIQGKSL